MINALSDGLPKSLLLDHSHTKVNS